MDKLFRQVLIGAILGVVLSNFSVVLAQEQQNPEANSELGETTSTDKPVENNSQNVEVFDDWQVVCSQAGECQMLQSLAVTEGGEKVFLISILNDKSRGAFFGIITLPLKVYLVPGVLMTVDKKRPFKIAYELCDGKGCHAGFELNSQVLNALRRGNLAKVRVWTAEKRAIDFRVSLKGFTKAYRYLNEKFKG